MFANVRIYCDDKYYCKQILKLGATVVPHAKQAQIIISNAVPSSMAKKLIIPMVSTTFVNICVERGTVLLLEETKHLGLFRHLPANLQNWICAPKQAIFHAFDYFEHVVVFLPRWQILNILPMVCKEWCKHVERYLQQTMKHLNLKNVIRATIERLCTMPFAKCKSVHINQKILLNDATLAWLLEMKLDHLTVYDANTACDALKLFTTLTSMELSNMQHVDTLLLVPANVTKLAISMNERKRFRIQNLQCLNGVTELILINVTLHSREDSFPNVMIACFTNVEYCFELPNLQQMYWKATEPQIVCPTRFEKRIVSYEDSSPLPYYNNIMHAHTVISVGSTLSAIQCRNAVHTIGCTFGSDFSVIPHGIRKLHTTLQFKSYEGTSNTISTLVIHSPVSANAAISALSCLPSLKNLTICVAFTKSKQSSNIAVTSLFATISHLETLCLDLQFDASYSFPACKIHNAFYVQHAELGIQELHHTNTVQTLLAIFNTKHVEHLRKFTARNCSPHIIDSLLNNWDNQFCTTEMSFSCSTASSKQFLSVDAIKLRYLRHLTLIRYAMPCLETFTKNWYHCN